MWTLCYWEGPGRKVMRWGFRLKFMRAAREGRLVHDPLEAAMTQGRCVCQVRTYSMVR